MFAIVTCLVLLMYTLTISSSVLCVLMVEGMSVVVNVMLCLMSVMSPPPALCNLSARTVVELCTLGVFALGFQHLAGLPQKNGKSGPHCWGWEGSAQFAQQFVTAVTTPPLVCSVVWSQHTSSLQTHPPTYQVVTPGFVDRARLIDGTAG